MMSVVDEIKGPVSKVTCCNSVSRPRPTGETAETRRFPDSRSVSESCLLCLNLHIRHHGTVL